MFFSRRHRGAGAVVLAALLTLSACSDSSDVETNSSATRSVNDANGQAISVPSNPQRVLALSEIDLDSSLALGVKPVATVNGRGQQGAPRYLADRASGIAIVGNVNTPTMDKVVEANPDLILAGNMADQQVIDQLKAIAPTVVTSKAGEDWRVGLDRVAQALNKTNEARTALDGYNAKVADAKTKLADNAGQTVNIVRWNPQGPGIMLRDAFASKIVMDLGLQRPASGQQPGATHTDPLSLEALGQLDADWVFIGTLASQGDAVKAMETAQATPAFQSLNAVKSNHLRAIDGSKWTSGAGVLAAQSVIDDVVTALA